MSLNWKEGAGRDRWEAYAGRVVGGRYCKASQCPLKFIASGQSPLTFGNPLIFGFAFRVVRIVGAGFRVGGSPQALRDFLF
jgi:hypothetical protein